MSLLTARGAIYPASAAPAVASYADRTVQRTRPARVHIGCRSFVAPFVEIDPQGETLVIGTASNLKDNVTVTGSVRIGDRVSIAHGATILGSATIGAPDGLPAFVGFNSVIDGAVVFRSTVGAGVQIGEFAYVDGCHLAPGTVVPARTVMVKDKIIGVVEW